MSLLKAISTLTKGYAKGVGSLIRASVGTVQGYEGAAYGRRLGNFRPTTEHINALLAKQGSTLTARARHLTTNTPYGVRGKSSFVGNAIGTGIFPAWKLTDRALRKKIHEGWTQFTDECDADGLTDFYGQQAIVCGALFDGGECFIRLRARRPSDGLLIPFQLQILEPEQLPLDYHAVLPNGNRIRSGIEFNGIGKRVAYHFFREHPGDIQPDSFNINDTVRIPAETVLHIFKPLRPGQIRGQTWLAAAIVKILFQDLYDDAELDRKKMAACLAGFIRRPADAEGSLGEDLEPDERGSTNAELSPGTMNVLLDGEEITFSSPTEVGGSYEAFQRRASISIMAAMNLPYSTTGDLQGVSYSGLREGKLELWRCLEQFLHMTMVFQMCRPVASRFMDDGVLSGVFPIPSYSENRADYNRIDWIPDKPDWVDPLNDRQAQNLAISMRIKSRTQAAREEGVDFEDVLDEIESEDRELARRGISIPLTTSSGNVKVDPTATAKDQQDQQDTQRSAPSKGANE